MKQSDSLNIFTGLLDPPLTPVGVEESTAVGRELAHRNIKFDVAYTSLLQRAAKSLKTILQVVGQTGEIEVLEREELNERDYGALNGRNKEEAAKEFGKEQVDAWRRGYTDVPPGGESLEMTCVRVMKFYEREVVARLKRGEKVLVVSSGNTLRGLVMKLEALLLLPPRAKASLGPWPDNALLPPPVQWQHLDVANTDETVCIDSVPQHRAVLAPKDWIRKKEGTTGERCGDYGWNVRVKGDEREVWDATIVSTELDLLLLRLHELSPVVSRFILLESTTTFTGLPKPLALQAALSTADFAPFKDKIVYRVHQGRKLRSGENPFTVENELRDAVSRLLRAELREYRDAESSFGRVKPPLLLFSDVDELPSRTTIGMLKKCEAPTPLHLALTEFNYSFEFRLGGEELNSWRAQVWEWKEWGEGREEFYRHGKVTERVFVEGSEAEKGVGWHCSWCFKHLNDFVVKATGYSHVDRLGNRPSALLRPERIQKTICEGSDFFRMLPEAYTWRDMVDKWSLIPQTNTQNIPKFLNERPDKFPYLLPGGCKRNE
ncbi:beta-1,4-mannosyl-glycoprotein beta-1,4-N-acetylglucosaminyltransferase [Pseudohyphozyma bogoriensis]|nr:beta-1,4-mannosyl-glycoprotein beta-1,4-N-acetylglucosaminyltransferase [Pseudohyphozyma bogoriensis]